MSHINSVLTAVCRPKILIRAARAGLVDYRRERDLKRLLRTPKHTTPSRAIDTLLMEEKRLESSRTTGEGTYNLQRHVALLTAVIAEARLLPASGMAQSEA